MCCLFDVEESQIRKKIKFAWLLILLLWNMQKRNAHVVLCIYLQQKINQWSLFAGRGKTEVVYYQDPHEVKNKLFRWMVCEVSLGAHIAVLWLASVHSSVCCKCFKFFCWRSDFIIKICNLGILCGKTGQSHSNWFDVFHFCVPKIQTIASPDFSFSIYFLSNYAVYYFHIISFDSWLLRK